MDQPTGDRFDSSSLRSVRGPTSSRNHYRFRCQSLSKNSADHALQAVKSVTKQPCLDYIDFQIKVSNYPSRNCCESRQYTDGMFRPYMKVTATVGVPGCQQERTQQPDASECLPYPTANVIFRKHTSSMETVLVLSKSNKINQDECQRH